MMQRQTKAARTRWVSLVVSFVACKAPAPPSTTNASASALPSIAASSVDASSRPLQTKLVSVVVGTQAQHLGIFPVGSRALIALGTTFAGYAQPHAAYVADAHVGDGLPTSGASHLQAVGGVWPDIAVVSGQKELAEYAGPSSVLFLERQGALVASKAAFVDVPRMAATSKGVAYLFIPEGTYFIGGLDLARCGKTTPADLPVLAIRGDQKVASPRAVPSFFAQALETDASGNGFVVGGDMCRAGAFVASLDSAPLRLELVPGSDACSERTNIEGMPFTHAHLFPSSSGGLYVLLVNQAASQYQPDDAKRRTLACAAPPRVLERSQAGAWSAARILPENASYIDPAGTAWAITDHQTVMRIPQAGASTELALDASCAQPTGTKLTGIVTVVVPFPDQPWISVTYEDDRTGLCVAYL